MSVKFKLPCIVCWDEGVENGIITELPGYPPEFLALSEAERGRLSMEALCPKHKDLPGLAVRSTAVKPPVRC